MDTRIVSADRVGVLCLQGGRELTTPCEEMDRSVLDRSEGHVVVLAGAARPGSDDAGASARTLAYYRTLGVDVTVVPDPRVDAFAALAALTGDVGLIVMCASTATPARSGGAAAALGLVAGMAVPHWSPGSERRWGLSASPLWGLPECGGVLIDDGRMSAVGQGDPSVRVDGTWHPVARSGTDTVPV